MEFETEDDGVWFEIRCVWYDDNGMPFRYSDDPMGLITEDPDPVKGMKSEIWAFHAAILKPILKPSDFPDHESEYSPDGDAK